MDMTFKFKLDLAEYAKRLGISIPDDSPDALSGNDEHAENADAQNGVAKDCACCDSLSDAEDATVSYAPGWRQGALAAQCQATLAQCKAKNPMTCRFHGAQVIANDIESMLTAAGISAPVDVKLIGVTSTGGKQYLSAQATVKGSASDQTAIESAMKQFFQLPGVEGDTDFIANTGSHYEAPFDIDMLDPSAKAKWGAGINAPMPNQPPSATPAPSPIKPPAPTPKTKAPNGNLNPPVSAPPPTPVSAPQVQHGGKLHPPVKPTKPPAFNGLEEDDFDFLDTVSMNLAWLEQRVNHNIAKGTKGAGTMALSSFKAIDSKRLNDLAKKDGTGQTILLKDLYDQAINSENNGWSIKIEPSGVAYDDTKYDGQNPVDSTGFLQWKFDRSKCPPDPYAKQRNAYNNWKDPALKREEFIDSCLPILASSDPDAPKKQIGMLKGAHEMMLDIEVSISELENAISQEQDPAVKSTLQKVMDDAEGEYFDAEKEYRDAVSEISKWQAKQHVMNGSIKDTINFIKARGGKVPPYMVNWQYSVDTTRPIAAKNTGVSNSDAIAKINCKSLYDRACKGEVTIGSQGRTSYFLDMLDGKHPFGEHLSGRFSPIAKNCFGANPQDDMSAFCRAMEGDGSKYKSWWGGDCVCIVNPRKAVMGINAHLYDGAENYGAHLKGSNLVLMTDADSAVLDCDNPTGGIVTKDCSKSSTYDFMRDTGLASGNEVHVLGGITLENCMAVKFFGSVPNFTSAQIAAIKKWGITVYNRRGNVVTL